VTDIVMPKMSGVMLASRVRDMRSRICVVYVTGYAPETVAEHGQLHGEVLVKPWSVEEKARSGAASIQCAEDTPPVRASASRQGAGPDSR
jgi:CheY-like chemotaxis protein